MPLARSASCPTQPTVAQKREWKVLRTVRHNDEWKVEYAGGRQKWRWTRAQSGNAPERLPKAVGAAEGPAWHPANTGMEGRCASTPELAGFDWFEESRLGFRVGLPRKPPVESKFPQFLPASWKAYATDPKAVGAAIEASRPKPPAASTTGTQIIRLRDNMILRASTGDRLMVKRYQRGWTHMPCRPSESAAGGADASAGAAAGGS
eukprot:TRINITY_DN44160_c0_g1_i2.p1 TRINITY_DN44160_c0_g1~~TRINITY_DN44160_c0_g1_i2.p1  ORF type:complete len:206 (+),score=33.31 TRINITY_DN44160_c0_g1_i2:135-752(+)